MSWQKRGSLSETHYSPVTHDSYSPKTPPSPTSPDSNRVQPECEYGSDSVGDGEPRVLFRGQENAPTGNVLKEREKYLTAKYPKNTMGLIRKRLAVEDWIDEQLKKLYNVPDDSYDTYDAIIDLDEVLDLGDESEKFGYIFAQVKEAPQSPEVIYKFVEDVLEKARDL